MEPIQKIQERHVTLMQQTVKTISHILTAVSQETATTLRDGPDGWTILEILCHLRDFDIFFYERAVMMLEQEHPALPAYDHEQIAIDQNYNGQDLRQTLNDLLQSRQRFVALFQSLTPEQWQRTGIHPERDHFSLTDAAIQVGTHDATHIEQMTRVLAA
ncbi:MAG: DinB family protein [Chloroflexota bacterium]